MTVELDTNPLTVPKQNFGERRPHILLQHLQPVVDSQPSDVYQDAVCDDQTDPRNDDDCHNGMIVSATKNDARGLLDAPLGAL